MSDLGTAVVASASVLAGVIVTATVQGLSARGQRKHERYLRTVEHKRALYVRYLDFLTHLPHAMASAMRDSRDTEYPRDVQGVLATFRAEFLIDGSDSVRALVKQVPPTFQRFVARQDALGAEDIAKPREDRAGASLIMQQAFDEAFAPLLASMGEAMRNDLESG